MDMKFVSLVSYEGRLLALTETGALYLIHIDAFSGAVTVKQLLEEIVQR
jgi:hypothetical protein